MKPGARRPKRKPKPKKAAPGRLKGFGGYGKKKKLKAKRRPR